MTIVIVDRLRPNNVLIWSDYLNYEIPSDIAKKLEKDLVTIKPENWQAGKWLHSVNRNTPKIFELSDRVAVAVGGSAVVEKTLFVGINMENASEWIIEKMKKLPHNENFGLGVFLIKALQNEISVERLSLFNGKVKKETWNEPTIILSMFGGLNQTFRKKYLTNYAYADSTKGKRAVVEQFFNDLSNEFNGNLGGKVLGAEISIKDGFKWI